MDISNFQTLEKKETEVEIITDTDDNNNPLTVNANLSIDD